MPGPRATGELIGVGGDELRLGAHPRRRLRSFDLRRRGRVRSPARQRSVPLTLRTLAGLGTSLLLLGACSSSLATSRDGGKRAPRSASASSTTISTVGVPAISSSTTAPVPAFVFQVAPLDEAVRARVDGSSWRPGCPVPLDELRYVTVSHWGFDGGVSVGELVVNQDVTADLEVIFRSLFEARYPIRSMRLVDDFGADDYTSIEADNSSAFNCRPRTGSTSEWSEHSFGRAIDINPLENPYVSTSGTTTHPRSQPYLDRTNVRTGMIVAGDAVVTAFASRGGGGAGFGTHPSTTSTSHVMAIDPEGPLIVGSGGGRLAFLGADGRCMTEVAPRLSFGGSPERALPRSDAFLATRGERGLGLKAHRLRRMSLRSVSSEPGGEQPDRVRSRRVHGPTSDRCVESSAGDAARVIIRGHTRCRTCDAATASSASPRTPPARRTAFIELAGTVVSGKPATDWSRAPARPDATELVIEQLARDCHRNASGFRPTTGAESVAEEPSGSDFIGMEADGGASDAHAASERRRQATPVPSAPRADAGCDPLPRGGLRRDVRVGELEAEYLGASKS